MRRQDALYAATCVGTIVFCVAFVLPYFTEQPIAWYFPLDRGWELTSKPTGLAIDFYGRCLQALVAAAASIVITLAGAKKLPNLPERIAGLLAAWAIAMVVLCMMYFVWTLAFRVPVAEPIPAWYVPR